MAVVMTGGLLRVEDMPPDVRDLVVEFGGQARQVVLPCDGCSGIIGPDGSMLAGPVLNEEVILTAKGKTFDLFKGAAGIATFMEKPYNIKILRQKVKEILLF